MEQQAEEKKKRFIDNTLSELGKANKSPIFGYQHLPVLPLEQAIETIIPLVPGLSEYAAQAKQLCNRESPLLSWDESASIYLYSMPISFFALLNENLRAENRHALKPWFSFLKLFITALQKLPSLESVVWRGISTNISSNFRDNTSLTWWSVNSCTTALNVVEVYLGDQGTVLCIQTYNGKDISEFSVFPEEHEVIIMPETLLHVKSNLLNFQDRLFIIHLEENRITSSRENRSSRNNGAVEYHIRINWEKREVSFNSMKCNDEDTDIIAQELRTNVHWKELRLCKNEISDRGATSLATALESNTVLRTLSLTENQVNNVGAMNLAHALKNNRTLEQLFLVKNQVGEEGARELAEMLKVNQTLTLLNLSSNPLSDAGTLAIIKVLINDNRSLQYLYLDKTEITFAIADDIGEMLRKNTSLETLTLDGNQMGDAGMQTFCILLNENTTLIEFSICDNHITDISTDYIKYLIGHNRTLKHFRIENNNFTNENKTLLEQYAEQNQFRLNMHHLTPSFYKKKC